MEEWIACVVLRGQEDKVRGSVPTIVVENEEERKKVALFLAKVFQGMVHNLENGIYFIVKHS